jgi:hypothetical protein
VDQQADFQDLQTVSTGDTTFGGVSVVIVAFSWLLIVGNKLGLGIDRRMECHERAFAARKWVVSPLVWGKFTGKADMTLNKKHEAMSRKYLNSIVV